MKTVFYGLLSVFLLAVIAFGGASYWVGLELHKDGTQIQKSVFTVKKGSSVSKIARDLEGQRLISENWLFIIGTKIKRADKKLRAGEYIIPAQASILNIIDILIDGKQNQHPVTIPEGLNSYQIIDILNKEPLLIGEIKTIPRDGTLFPETYYFTKNTEKSQIIKRMQAKMREIVTEEWKKREKNPHIKSIRQMLTLASIIEKETGINSERKKIAGVFINRLNKGIKLQTDPTVIYAVTNGGKNPLKRKLYNKDLAKPHPYNTYHIAGLPPAPICHPGYASIIAAMHPEKHSYLYFVANGKGGHNFAKNLSGHNKNVAKWRKLRKK